MPEYKKIKLYNGEVEILFDDSIDAKTGKQKHVYYRLDYENPLKSGGPRKKRLCGVTTFLNIIDKPALIGWAVGITVDYIKNNLDKITLDAQKLLAEAQAEAERVKKEAGSLGSEIHSWIERHIKGEKPEMPEDENVKRGVISFLDWESENKVEYLESERIVYSRKHDFVGTLDIIARVNGELYLVDLKTGNAIWQEHHAQVAAYMKADMEERQTNYAGRIILRISKETEKEYEERIKDKPFFIKAREKDENAYPYQVFEAVYLDKDGPRVEQDFAAFLSALKIYRWKQQK